LNLAQPDGSFVVADALLAEFNNNYSPDVNLQDAAKLGNINESFGLLRNGVLLAIERRPMIVSDDTLYFRLTKTTARNYQFAITLNNMDAPGLFAQLEDKFTGSATPLNMTGSTTINFSINGTPASATPDRFRVTFKTTSVLPVTYTDVTARQKGKDIEVNWKVEEQLNIDHYEIEKSFDGRNFVKAGTQAVTGTTTSTYNWVDVNATAGDNYYRIRNVDRNGSYAYSKVVSVKMGSTPGSMVVYPNPVTNSVINLQLTNLPAGTYIAQLVAASGQVLLVKEIRHPGGTSSQKIPLQNETAKGAYQLEVIHPDKSTVTKISVLNL
ncbi:MAG: T9SS type A sorting domain-containing protein, partial [Ferruginibacter sp.]